MMSSIILHWDQITCHKFLLPLDLQPDTVVFILTIAMWRLNRDKRTWSVNKVLKIQQNKTSLKFYLKRSPRLDEITFWSWMKLTPSNYLEWKSSNRSCILIISSCQTKINVVWTKSNHLQQWNNTRSTSKLTKDDLPTERHCFPQHLHLLVTHFIQNTLPVLWRNAAKHT